MLTKKHNGRTFFRNTKDFRNQLIKFPALVLLP